jgi:hypothetical protein
MSNTARHFAYLGHSSRVTILGEHLNACQTNIMFISPGRFQVNHQIFTSWKLWDDELITEKYRCRYKNMDVDRPTPAGPVRWR